MKTSLPRNEIFSRALTQFGAAHYNVQSQSETSIILNNGKDINWILFVVFFCLAGIGAIIYWAIAKQHQIAINIMPVDGRFEITGTGNTAKAQQTLNTFLSSLPSAS